MTWRRVRLGAADNDGVVSETTEQLGFQGVLRNVTVEDTESGVIELEHLKVLVLDKEKAQAIWDKNPDPDDEVTFDDVDYKVVMALPKYWRGELRALDIILRAP